MDFLQELGSHRGGLLLLKTQLWWRGGRGWDGIRGRVCLLMDARVLDGGDEGPAVVALPVVTGSPQASALLLVDGALVWVWVAQADVELLS